MADRRGARVYPIHIAGRFSGTALIDSPSGVLSPGTPVSVKVDGHWRPAVVRAPDSSHSSGVCLELVTPAVPARAPS